MSLSATDLECLRRVCGATDAVQGERIQELWSGYGEIRRVSLQGAQRASVVVKRVEPPSTARHRRGWNTQGSHQRKLKSYQVEMAFYQRYGGRCDEACRVPAALHCEGGDGRWLFVLEDLDDSGFGARCQRPSAEQLHSGLAWLAHFHASFMGQAPAGLWPTGTYWHLATRPDELSAMAPGPLHDAAAELDARLSQCTYQTLVHGDAKLANFCFAPAAPAAPAVAAVDFQYVGGGCGMKDLAYFLGSCLDEAQCADQADTHLDSYFALLRQALAQRQPGLDVDELERQWRQLYPLAWADFTRFLLGWAPDHQKLHGYTLQMTERALRSLGR